MDSPSSWDVARVCGWLESEGLACLEESFRLHKIDGAVLLGLTEKDLKHELGVQVFNIDICYSLDRNVSSYIDTLVIYIYIYI